MAYSEAVDRREMKRSAPRKVSPKMQVQQREEAKLKARMIWKHDRYCMNCGRFIPSWDIIDKHEVLPRSLGGDPLNEDNCVLLGRFCCHEAEKTRNPRRTNREEFPYFKERLDNYP